MVVWLFAASICTENQTKNINFANTLLLVLPNMYLPLASSPGGWISVGDNGGHSGGVVALALGQSAAEGSPKDYVITASTDGTMGVFKTSDGTVTYKHKCGEGVTALAVFDPRPGASALLLVGYQVGLPSLFSPLLSYAAGGVCLPCRHSLGGFRKYVGEMQSLLTTGCFRTSVT